MLSFAQTMYIYFSFGTCRGSSGLGAASSYSDWRSEEKSLTTGSSRIRQPSGLQQSQSHIVEKVIGGKKMIEQKSNMTHVLLIKDQKEKSTSSK